MRQLNYISLIHKELTGVITSDENRLLDVWLKSDSGNLSIYEDTVAIWEASNFYQPDFQPDVDFAFQKFVERKNSEQGNTTQIIRMKPKYFLRGIAAAIVFLISALVIWNNSSDQIISADEERTLVSLDDGTDVWLDKGSSIRIHKNFGSDNRTIDLEGEAYFDVKRNEALPFEINTDNFQVTVLGTAFNVRSDGDHTVAVQRGKVRVFSGNEPVVLTKGQKATLNSNGVLEKSDNISSNEFSWMNEELSFNDTPLDIVASDLSNYYNTEIILSQEADVSCTYNSPQLGRLSLEDALRIISKVAAMEYEFTTEGNVLITTTDCK